MGKTSTKLAVYALVQLLLLHLSGLVAAANIFFHAAADDCHGPGHAYEDVPAYRCAPSPGFASGSVHVLIVSDARVGYFGQGWCSGVKFFALGSRCAVGGGYTGVAWAPGGTASDDAEKACDVQAKPTGIVYSEKSTEGSRILSTYNVTEMYTQMDTIPDAQQVDWLQAHGATFKSYL